ncbi:molybdenum cofactor guanylyltransferase [Naumannella halotolerans]|uniref:Molybdopterin-guanine dinucleotide biosynthesis protein A n=1 Tax=Naumannella halotolerans TaxID=993414 RepID=A0A4R7JBU3_9ACTN|nr:molybdenum cofactor guanylyltransferase [Naumannella halotolerans]TDT34466.1 molybdopterin-guanine dinucleotide biosynthesis protein A [Naumannella halotolerans]
MAQTRALVLTGGESSRMGRHKPAIEVDGTSLVERVLLAAFAYRPVVVGRPDGVVSAPVIPDTEPGAGPVAGIATGLEHLGAELDDTDRLLVLAADLPLLTAHHLRRLVDAEADCVVTSSNGRLQWLCACWQVGLLRRQLAATPPAGRSVRSLAAGVAPLIVTDTDQVALDVDTPDDLQQLIERDPGESD